MIYFKRPYVFLNCLFDKEIKNIIVYEVKYIKYLIRTIIYIYIKVNRH
jgi:hypothetical protein